MSCLVSIFFLGMGLLCIFARDTIWELHVENNKWKGVASERTDEWETMTIIGGVGSVILGLFMLYIFFHGG